ncbi:MAG: hypothetical protein QF380_06115, partial [Candidatus Marinimicrobia bacterium]|nr:hypothetical protein [Candidatus Neomarinimicrobiota bacterium]
MKRKTHHRPNFVAAFVFVTALTLTLVTCTDENKEPGAILLSTILTSDNLASTTGQALSTTGDCGESSALNYCLTPANVSGMVFYLGIMMGEA